MSDPREMEGNVSGGFSDEDVDPTIQEGYRREIEDIVKGFILEKELLLQGHQEEISRMRDQFSSERSGLYKHFEKERNELLRSSKIGHSAANETSVHQFNDFDTSSAQAYGLSSSPSEASAQGLGNLSPRKSREFHDHASNGSSSNLAKEIADEIDSQANRVTFVSSHHSGASARGSASSAQFAPQGYLRHTSDAVDLNLVKEIAEVYMRMNSGAIASHVRPDLDLEDKFERERDALERRLQTEKREVKRKLEDDYNRKLEQERSAHEEEMQELKTVNSDLQWQKRDLENRLRHNKEKWELNFEREKNDFEKRQLQSVHDIKRKLEERHTVELQKQRQKYEENITELQADITKLTSQLRELNENLTQEKDIIMIKFEREIKEMEQEFIDQRNALKMNLESEFVIRLENETTILKTVNGKLKEDLETLEREKKELERKYKDERRKAEETHDEDLCEMERSHSEEKRNIKTRYEERFQQLLEKDKATLEETIMELTDEVVALREENSQIELALNERNEELRRQIELERAEVRQSLMTTREEIKAQLEQEYSQKTLEPTASREAQSKEQDIFMMKTKYEETQMELSAMREEKDKILREKEQMQRKIKSLESDLGDQMDARTGVTRSKGEVETLHGIVSAKENEVASVKLENQELEINLSAVKRQKMDLEDEIASLKRRLAQASSDNSDQRRAVDNSEVVSLQESLRRKQEEVRVLQKETFDADSKQASWQRKNEELEDELAIMRRKKLEVEDEISALKRDKADLDSHFTSLRKEKADVEELFMNLKRKTADLEDMVSASKRDKMDLEHEIALLKKQNTTMEIDIHRGHYNNHERPIDTTQQSVSEVSIETSHCLLEDPAVATSRKEENELKSKIRELTDKKRELEAAIVELAQEEEVKRVRLQGMSKEIQSDLENQGKSEESTWILNKQEEELKQKISALKEEHLDLESRLSHLQREEARTEESCKDLKQAREDLEKTVKTLKYNKSALEKAVENTEREKIEQDNGVMQAEYAPQTNNAPQQNQRNHPKDKVISRLTSEKQDLQKEISSVKKQLALLQSELSTTKSVHFSQEALKIDEREISRLKKSSLELERQIAILKRQKTEIEAEITVIGEVKTREEKDLISLRRERVEIDIQLTTLQCQKTRLQAEIAVIRDDRKNSETEIETLRKEKTSMEKQVYGIQSQKLKLEADVEAVEESCRKKGNAVTGLSSEVTDAEKELEQLRQQKTDLQTEVIRLQTSKSKEESEITSARQQKLDLEQQMTQLKTQTTQLSSSRSPRYHNHGSTAGHNDAYFATEGQLGQHLYTGGSDGLFSSQVVANGFQEHGHLSSSRRDHSGAYLSPRTHASKAGQDERHITKEEQMRKRYPGNSVSTNVQIHRFQEASGLSSYGREEGNGSNHLAGSSRKDGQYDGRSSQALLGSHVQQNNGYLSHEMPSLNSSTFQSRATIKEDNDLVSLRRERQDLQLEISELRIELTNMQTEIENAKIELETNVGTVMRSVQADSQFSVQGDSQFRGFQDESTVFEARGQDRRDTIIQEYERQIRELKQRKVELEQKVSVLEWQLENTKQKMEIQEMSHRRELSSAREKILSTGLYHSLSDREAEKLKAFYDRISFLLVKRDGSSEEIMKQIKMEMKNLDQKVDLQCKSMSDFQSMSSSVKMEEGKFQSSRREDPGQLRVQLEAADEQLKTCEAIIQRLYGENEDLSKVISKLEGNLKSASRTEEKLQRKKVLLQKLVDQLSGHVKKDALHQSYLVVELDKDVSV